jgi:hypothetical protein
LVHCVFVHGTFFFLFVFCHKPILVFFIKNNGQIDVSVLSKCKVTKFFAIFQGFPPENVHFFSFFLLVSIKIFTQLSQALLAQSRKGQGARSKGQENR